MRRTSDDERIARLCRWFARHARPLPWRVRRDGYRALVAEMMLQQTQVARVVECYEAFLDRFPTIQDLARATEQEVLAAWQGLGYYRRARHLRESARLIVERYAGEVPAEVSALLGLPGVGRYTAGALASIVSGVQAPIVDGNVQRVLARWYGRGASPDAPGSIDWSWRQAEKLVRAAAEPGVFNEAMMELGATVCTPANPRCEDCPVAGQCAALRLGRPERLPPPRRAARQVIVHHHAVIIERGGTILLERRPDDGLWPRLWQVPTIDATRPLRPSEVRRRLPFDVTRLDRHSAFEYRTTHRRITFHLFRARTRLRGGTWRRPDDVADLPMGNAQRRVIRAGLGPSAPRRGAQAGLA